MTGKDELIGKMLEVDPESKIPFVFHRVYQHVFTAIYMLASLMGTIYPPPDLLSSSGQGVLVKSLQTGEQAKVAEVAEETEPAKPAEPTEPVVWREEEAEATEPMQSAEPVDYAFEREETTDQQTEASAT